MRKSLSFFSFLALFGASFLLSNCGSFDDMFNDTGKAPLKGERISVLQLQTELTPNPELQKTPVLLPDPWTNRYWSQAGGNPSHAMGHLSLGKDLKKIWSVSIGSGGNRRNPLITQPAVANGTVFTVDIKGRITAFALDDGKKNWQVSSVPSGEEDSGTIGGGIAWADGRLYVTSGYKHLLCLNPATGAVVWRVATSSPARAAPSVLDGRVYLITLDNRLMVFSAANGKLLWNYASVTETTNLLGSVSPAVDAFAAVFPMSSGEIVGLRVENGQIVWEDNLSGSHRIGALSSISDIRGQPVIDQGLVYAASYSGRMVAIDEVSGQRVWQREVGSAEMPWAAGLSVFIISSGQQLISLTRQNGDIRWITPLTRFEDKNKEEPVVWTGPVLAGGRLILASNRGQMIEADPQNGKILKKTRLPGDVTIAPLVSDNTLIFLTRQGNLVAYR
ncbi:MAG: PQQ-binding-like beta-propeller repeat protein [Alphaproteobacteria bacterium]|nr:PQQ-binding-like beta-propeller repeat protein [Alphaproteobacteria bacterium]